MKYFTYILYSASHDKYYVGQTDNFENRLIRHNSGYEKSTSPYLPWIKIFVIEKPYRSEAMALEKKLKNLSKERLKQFIRKYSMP